MPISRRPPAHQAATPDAVELSVDEALSAGASQLGFSQPLPFYLENFCSSLWWRDTGGLLRQVERTVDPFDQWRRGQGSEHHIGVTSLDVDGSGKPANAN